MRRAVLFAALLLGGCSHSYPPPPQRAFSLQPSDLDPPFMEVTAHDAGEYVVKDVYLTLGIGERRWTAERPELRFLLNKTEGQRFVADVVVEGYVLERVGPLNITVWINGNRLGIFPCNTLKDYHLEKPVPASWLKTGEYTDVVLQADKIFTSEIDGLKFGFSLYRAGFVE